jgi:hypothetical protein
MPTASPRRSATVTALQASAEPVQPLEKPDVADPATAFRQAAQGYALDALKELERLMQNANSEAVRVSAANALIDRAYGRAAPAVRVGGDNPEDGQGVSLTFTWLDPTKS